MIVGLQCSHNGEQLFHCFWLCFTYILMPHKMVILYFPLPCFHVSNTVALYFNLILFIYYLHSNVTLVLSFYTHIVLTLSIENIYL